MPGESPSSQAAGVAAREVLLALGNALKLSASLAVTLSVAIAVRFWMPRFLGPEAFGTLHFAEEFAAAVFVLGTLGVDTYIHREVATRPEHASEFFGGLTVIRTVFSVVLLIAMSAILHAMGKTETERHLAYLFAVGQILFVLNGSLGALLQAARSVVELAVVNALSKMLWGGGIVAALLLGGGLHLVALSFVVTELLKTPVLLWASRRHLGLRLTLNRQATMAMVIASLPYFINYMAYRIYVKVDVSMISGLTNDAEVGWYGAAVNVTYAIMLFLPVVNAVVIPMGSRIAVASHTQANLTMRGAVRLATMFTVPMALLIGLNADAIVELLYTERYAPTVGSLRLLAPLMPITFITVLNSMHLIQLGRIWRVALVSLLGLVINPTLNALLIVPVHQALGDGGAGVAAAATTVMTEIVVAVPLFLFLGRAARDPKLGWLLLKLLVTGAIIGVVHVAMGPQGLWRLLAESALYLVLAPLLGALPLKDIMALVKGVLARRVAPRNDSTAEEDSE